MKLFVTNFVRLDPDPDPHIKTWWIRIHIKMNSWIRIRKKWMRIHSPVSYIIIFFQQCLAVLPDDRGRLQSWTGQRWRPSGQGSWSTRRNHPAPREHRWPGSSGSHRTPEGYKELVLFKKGKIKYWSQKLFCSRTKNRKILKLRYRYLLKLNKEGVVV